MLGQRSLKLELISLDPDLGKTLRRNWRAPVERETVEMRDNVARNVNQLENLEQLRGENEQSRAT